MAEVTRELFEQMRDTAEMPLRKFVVVSGSMEPLIPIGQEVIVSVKARPKRFDVIAFWGRDRLICHVLWHVNRRISSAGEQLYQSVTLNGVSIDRAIPESDYLGVIVNYRLSVWNKLKLVWRLRARGL